MKNQMVPWQIADLSSLLPFANASTNYRGVRLGPDQMSAGLSE